MTDMSVLATIPAAAVAVAMISIAGLKAWRRWLDLKHLELSSGRRGAGASPSPGQRIELADLKERVRKLEAIANGIDN